MKKLLFVFLICLTINSLAQTNSLPMSGPVVINNTLTVTGGAAIGSTLGMGNNNFIYWNDAGGTARRVIGATSSNNVHIGDVDNVMNGSSIYQTKNSHNFYNNTNYTFSISQIGQIAFSNNVWHGSIDGIKRFYFGLNGTTYFGTNNSYVFRNAADADIAYFTPQGNLSVSTNQSTGDTYTEIGAGRTGNGNSYIDLMGDATYNDYGLRLIRGAGGANTDSYLQNRGTGTLNIDALDSGGSVALKTGGIQRIFVNTGGNVGIGTTNPKAKFQVNNLTTSGTSEYLQKWSFDTDNWWLGLEQQHFGGSHVQWNFKQKNYNSEVDLMSFKLGNVGIGTTTPAYKLDVNGSSRTIGSHYITGNFDGTARIVYIPSNGVGNTWELYPQTSGYGIYDRTNSSYRYFIANNGNVGIGTTNPQSKLQIDVPTQNGSPTSALRLSATGTAWGNTGASLEFYNQDNGGVNLGSKIASLLQNGGANAQKTDLAFYTTNAGINTEKFRINSAGNVGIGTTNPNAKLDVLGGIINRKNADDLSPNVWIQSASTASKGLFIRRNATEEPDGTAFYSINNNTYPLNLFLGENGQVGIGINSIPTDYKLAVAGNVIAEKVKVKKQSSGWPDYVFAPSYKLPSLIEVEKFVKQNSHLPEIPSATEIEKDGQDLGDMNRLLLEKVEELTLYLIDQNKEIKALKSKVEQLEKK